MPGDSKVALLVYRSMLRAARSMTKDGRSFKLRNLDRDDSVGNFSMYAADKRWWRSELQEMVPGFVAGSEPADGLFRGAALEQCVRENFRAQQDLQVGSQEREEALDSGITALRVLRKQLQLEDNSSGVVTDRGVMVEATGVFDGEDEEGFRFVYRLLVQNNSPAKVRLRQINWKMTDGRSQEADVGKLRHMGGPSPTLHPGECLECTQYTWLPTAEGTMQGTIFLQSVGRGRRSLKRDDRFTASVGPLKLRS